MNKKVLSSFSFRGHPEGRAILISLGIGFIIVILKVGAFLYSGSMALMADMLESLVHNLAVMFAAWCLWYSHRPADVTHLYGHGKFQFLSSAVEGSLVCAAGLLIIVNSIEALFTGYSLKEVKVGMSLAVAAALVNAMLAVYLIQTGKREKSIIVQANGMHILSDVVTTGASLVGVLAAVLTGWIVLDLVVAILAAIYIIFEGLKLLRSSMAGLLDEANRDIDRTLRQVLQDECDEHDWTYHALRHRTEGRRIWVELHLVLDQGITLEDAHDQATHLEDQIREAFHEPVFITTHLEPRVHGPQNKTSLL